jgi:rhamnosyltransferase
MKYGSDDTERGNNSQPNISIIIPTRNGASTLRELLAVLTLQTVQPDEVLVVDSSSDDDTVEIAREYGAVVSVIPQQSFDHGGTRTDIARAAKGELLVFFTQDALPATRDALEKLLEPFAGNPDLAVCYGRQLAGKEAGWAAASLRLFNYPPHSCLRGFADRGQYGLKTIFVSNSFAAYRKSILSEVGYFKNGLIFGEDTCTVGRLLERGYRIAYVSEAKVYHSHNYTLAEEFRRSFDTGVLHTTEKWLLDTYGHAEGVGLKFIQSQLSTLIRQKKYSLVFDVLLRAAAKYSGYRLGRLFRKIPAACIPYLSMHKSWWAGKTGKNDSRSAR